MGAVNADKLNVIIGGANLVRNPSFENTVYGSGNGRTGAGYAVYNNNPDEATIYDVQANGRNGGYSQLVQWTGAQTSTKGVYLTNVAGIDNSNIMQPNKTYMVSWWARGGGSALGAGISLRWNTAPNVTTITNPPLQASTWQRYVFKLVWGGTVDPSVFITTDYFGSTAGYYYIDDIQIEEGDTLTSFKPSLLSGEVTGQLVSNAAISNAKLADNAVTARTILAGEVQAGHIAANAITANKLVIASRPISVSGLNVRIENNGYMAWSDGTVIYADDAGVFQYKSVVAGSQVWGGWDKPVNLCYNATTGSATLGIFFDVDVNSGQYGRQIPLALWSGGTQLSPRAGVSTIINGDRIVTGSIAASKIVAQSIGSEQIAANSISALKMTLATKPISVAGCNIRVEGGIVRWDAGSLQYVGNDGILYTKTVTAGSQGWGGWNQPVNLCYNTDVDNNGFGWIYYNQDLANYSQMIPVAVWNSASSDLAVKAGVSTYIAGDRIVTGTIEARAIKAGTLTADKIQAGTIGAAQIASGAITADKLLVSGQSDLNKDPGFRAVDLWANNGVALNGPLLTSPGGGWYNRHGSDIDALLGTTQYIMLWEAYFRNVGRQHVFGAVQYNMKGGVTYEFSAYGNNQSNQYMAVYFRSFAPDGTYLGDEALIWEAGEAVQTKSKQITPPTNASAYQFIIFNGAPDGVGFLGHMECTNISMKRVSGATAIANGAITTDKITVNSLDGDRIRAGSLSADKIQAGTVLAGSVTVAGAPLSDVVSQAANSSTLTWSIYGAQYGSGGNRVVKLQPPGWYSNVYSQEAATGGARLTGRFTDAGTFFGLTESRAVYNNTDFTLFAASWHRSVNGNMYIYFGGEQVGMGAQGDYDMSQSFSIVYDGKFFIFYYANIEKYRRATTPNRMFFAGVSIDPVGASVAGLVLTGSQDNSMVNMDPAAAVNAKSTNIDPGKITISGGTTLASWRYGGDVTKIEGGALGANTVSANKLTVGNRGIGYIGINFEWNPTNNWVYWSDGYVYYTNDAGTLTSDYVAAGNTGGAGAHQWFFWSPGQGIRFSQESPGRENVIMFAAWWGGSNLNVTYGGTIINGDRITTNTIHANKIIAGTITATQIQAGSISADRLSVGSLSAISANIGTLVSYNGAGGRIERDGNGDRGYYNNGVLGYEAGFLN